MFNLFGMNDTNLQADVVKELKWDPSVTACDIITTAKRGIITLLGLVPHYLEKKMAEAAWWAPGVTSVTNSLIITPS